MRICVDVCRYMEFPLLPVQYRHCIDKGKQDRLNIYKDVRLFIRLFHKEHDKWNTQIRQRVAISVVRIERHDRAKKEYSAISVF